MAESVSSWHAFNTVLRRDLLLAFRKRSELLIPLLFFVIIATLFPLAMKPNALVLQSIGPGVVWVSALLATILSLQHMFRSDFEDGFMEQLVLSAHPPTILVMAKIFSHWLVSGLPLLLISPLIATFYQMSADAGLVLFVTLLLGTPLLSLVGAIGTALTVGLSGGGMLISLLILPLYIPVLIFATDASMASLAGLPVAPQLLFLGALLVLAITLAPLATAAALRVSLS